MPTGAVYFLAVPGFADWEAAVACGLSIGSMLVAAS